MIVLVICFIIYMFPFVMVVINSFKTKRDIIKEPLSLIGTNGASVANYVEAFTKMNFPRTFMNSLCVTGISVLLIIVVSSMCAYIFVRTDYKLNKIFFSLMIASMVIPFQVIMIPLVSIYGGQLHLLNHRMTLILMHVGFSTAMSVFMYHGFIKSSIPLSLEEAARLDGCSRHQTFFRIVLPLLKPTTATLVILYAMGLWNDFLLPSLVLTKKRTVYASHRNTDVLRNLFIGSGTDYGFPDHGGDTGYYPLPVPAEIYYCRCGCRCSEVLIMS